jgi:nitrogenase-stabilizing/protective protein
MTTVLDRLNGLSSAEDFFAVLGVPHDPEVLNVARLHILRRMRDLLAATPPTALTAEAAAAALAAAHAEFARHAPLERRLFKVHQDAVRPRGFVPLAALTGG